MRGDTVFRVYGQHTGREEDVFFGAFRTRDEAEAEIGRLQARSMDGDNWAARYHDRGFVVRTAAVETDFEVPPQPKPRDRYAVRAEPVANRPGTWDSTRVEVLRRVDSPQRLEKVGEFLRNYALLSTFEPFRQGGRDYALISRRYTRTAVMDLSTGEVIAEESESVPGGGFCPVGFYVPDWWDLHDGRIIPGSQRWTADHEWPTGEFGFVWGCHWGDDSSWKVQVLDLRHIAEGRLTREERFGYVPLSTRDYAPPWLDLERSAASPSKPPGFIRLQRYQGQTHVHLDVELDFDLESGKVDPEQLSGLKTST